MWAWGHTMCIAATRQAGQGGRRCRCGPSAPHLHMPACHSVIQSEIITCSCCLHMAAAASPECSRVAAGQVGRVRRRCAAATPAEPYPPHLELRAGHWAIHVIHDRPRGRQPPGRAQNVVQCVGKCARRRHGAHISWKESASGFCALEMTPDTAGSADSRQSTQAAAARGARQRWLSDFFCTDRLPLPWLANRRRLCVQVWSCTV